MKQLESGQALIEWAIFLPLYVSLFVAIAAFGQWFTVRHQLIAATRQAAFLYSSGRLTNPETRALVQLNLRKGFPSLRIPNKDIVIGKREGIQARMFRLDEIKITYQPTALMKLLKFKPMEEKCVIKHAPSYWPTEVPGVSVGPPVSW